MRLLLINADTPASITDLVARRAREFAPAGTEFDVVTARFGQLFDSLECAVGHLVELASVPKIGHVPPSPVETVGLDPALAPLMGFG
jgi:hypothetical protein